jgi:hypothetical protein
MIIALSQLERLEVDVEASALYLLVINEIIKVVL